MTLGAMLLGLLSSNAGALAGQAIPACIFEDREQPIDNARVLEFKRSAPANFKTQAHIDGVVTRGFGNRTGHLHFEIALGQGANDVIEVIANSEFGVPSSVRPGMRVEVCGEYINANRQAQRPSPSGSIIHWVHQNICPNDAHPQGFMVVDGVLFGWSPDDTANRHCRDAVNP